VSPSTELILVAFCIVLQGFFSGSEIAIVGSDRLVLRSRSDNGDAAAKRVLKLLERPTQLVGTCLIGTNTATIAGATMMAHLLGQLGDVPELLVVAVYTPITIIFSEMVPKSIFQQYANTLAPIVSRPISALSVALSPALWALEHATRIIMTLLGAKGAQVHAVRREDIQLLLDSATTTDIHEEEKEMILRVFNFSETQVADAMVPLIEVVGVPETATCGEARSVMIEHGFSRLVVYRKRIDRLVGMVMHSDLLFAPDDARPVGSVMHEIMYVPETKRVDELFVDLRRKRQRLAVAVDEYGGAVGLISIEDILEEIVGDIEDEYDRRRPLVRKMGERQWVASGRVEAEDLLGTTGFEMPEGDYETLAGFLLTQLGHVPAAGERLVWGRFVLTVALANERAILEVDIQNTVPRTARES
jgi:CBS domain containing-hemolysin-like protein